MTAPLPPNALERLSAGIRALRAQSALVRMGGSVVLATPTHYRVAGLSRHARLGDCVELEADGRRILGQVIRVDPDAVTIKCFEDDVAIGLGSTVWRRAQLQLHPCADWKGRVIDAIARPLDRKGPLPQGPVPAAIEAPPPDALQRERIGSRLTTGVRVIDLFTPLCSGQRVGVFAGSGVGKSTLLGMLARSVGFDSSVIALVGERGREVREFVDEILGAGLERSVVVVATGNESPMMRRQAPRTAMCIAEHLRDRGERVLLIVDSITRYAHALREVALAGGEPPVMRGYSPSVFSDLPRLLERAGPGVGTRGSITGIFSVLVDGDDHNEPVSDAVRGILDGHIVLDGAIASRGQYPAVDILRSVSRLADKAWSEPEKALVKYVRSMIAEFEETRDLRLMGAYKTGSSAAVDRAVRIVPQLYEFLVQVDASAGAPDVFHDLATRIASWG